MHPSFLARTVIVGHFARAHRIGSTHLCYRGSPATLTDAAAALQGGEPARAAKMLEAITEREPKNAPAWSLLGTVYKGGKQFDKAARLIDSRWKWTRVGRTRSTILPRWQR